MQAQDAFAIQLRCNAGALQANGRGLTHEESLRHPPGGGNCLNWIVGHLLATRDRIGDAFGHEPQLSRAESAVYGRGTTLDDPSKAVDYDELLRRFAVSQGPLEAAIADLDEVRLSAPAPFSPGQNEDETLGSLLALLMFHEAYHVGQVGTLRRTLGHDGAIA